MKKNDKFEVIVDKLMNEEKRKWDIDADWTGDMDYRTKVGDFTVYVTVSPEGHLRDLRTYDSDTWNSEQFKLTYTFRPKGKKKEFIEYFEANVRDVEREREAIDRENKRLHEREIENKNAEFTYDKRFEDAFGD